MINSPFETPAVSIEEALDKIRVLGYHESRDISKFYEPGSDQIAFLKPVSGSERRSVTIGTSTEHVVLSLSEQDFDALISMIGRLQRTR